MKLDLQNNRKFQDTFFDLLQENSCYFACAFALENIFTIKFLNKIYKKHYGNHRKIIYNRTTLSVREETT